MFYTGHRVVLIWDGLSSHWSHRMRAHLNAQRHWLTVERLPAYAPELNPAEYLRANLKGEELANCTGDTIAEVADHAHHGIQRVCDSDSLAMAFELLEAAQDRWGGGQRPTSGRPGRRRRPLRQEGDDRASRPGWRGRRVIIQDPVIHNS